MIRLLPRSWRKALIDAVYGAEEERGATIYLASLWGAGLLAILLLAGLTPWNWPAERDGRVETLQPITCEAILGEDAADGADDTNTAKSAGKARPKAPNGRTGCRALLSDAERAQLGRVEETVAYLQRGGPTPPALSIPDDTALRRWVDGNVCRLGGVEGADRGALAWHVGQGVGECGAVATRAAGLPLSIWLGWWVGLLVTPLLLLALVYFLAKHTIRLPATRRAYRRLYGSEHKAP